MSAAARKPAARVEPASPPPAPKVVPVADQLRYLLVGIARVGKATAERLAQAAEARKPPPAPPTRVQLLAAVLNAQDGFAEALKAQSAAIAAGHAASRRLAEAKKALAATMPVYDSFTVRHGTDQAVTVTRTDDARVLALKVSRIERRDAAAAPLQAVA